MKNILLILLLANILYFIWGLSVEEESHPGVAIVSESDLGPPLDVTVGRDGDSVASVGAVLGSGEASALEAVVGRACVSIGPFRETADADSAVLEYSNEGMKAVLRAMKGQIFVGHWVQRLLYYRAPEWMFTALYVAWATATLATLRLVPPRR